MLDRIRIVGDVHGKMGGYEDVLKQAKKDEVPTLQIGDFGFKKSYEMRDMLLQKHGLEVEDHTFFGGNHDEYPVLESYQHLGDFGHVPNIPKSFFVRGAQSPDKNRRTPGYDWFPEEELSYRDLDKALAWYRDAKPRIVFSHDAPESAARVIFEDRLILKDRTSTMLGEMLKAHEPEIWIFGHWHTDVDQKVGDTRFVCLPELSIFDLQPNKYLQT